MKHCISASVLLVSMMWMTAALSADRQEYYFDIPSQNAGAALLMFGEQADISVVYQYDLVKSITSNTLKGYYSIPQAIRRLLHDTGLVAEIKGRSHLVIHIDTQRRAMNNKKKILAAVISVFTGGHAVASTLDVESDQWSLEEIVVTAQKREQNLQEVPVAVSVFSGQDLARSGLNNPSSMEGVVPNMIISQTDSGDASLSLRGVGSLGSGAGHDPGVAIHMDGHYLQSSAFLFRDFLDVERVEVLRGPQGTLYGKNAAGGSINVITKKPKDDFEAEIGFEVGNYDLRKTKAIVNLPINESLSARFSGVTEERDGYTKNVSGGKDLEASDYRSVRGAVLYSPTDDVEVLISAYDYKNEDLSNGYSLIYGYPDQPFLPNVNFSLFLPNPFLQPGVVTNVTASDYRKTKTSFDPTGEDKAKGYSVDVSWYLNGLTIKSLTSVNESETNFFSDPFTSDVVKGSTRWGSLKETFSQELQLAGDAYESIHWVAGLYYYKEESEGEFGVGSFDIVGIGLPSVFGSAEELETTSVGAFGQIDHQITDRWELTYGLRYSRDEKEYKNTGFSFDIWDENPFFSISKDTMGTIDAEDEWSKVTGRFAANYEVTENVSAFASVSTGYKAGGIFGELTADPETVVSYELGIKSLFCDDRAMFNATAFYADYKDKQVIQTIDLQTVFNNAEKAEIYGVEIEFDVRPLEGLSLGGHISYMQAEYNEFDSVFDETTATVQDLSGNEISRAPDWTVGFNAAYTWFMGDFGDLTASADYSWVDETYFRAFNTDQDLRPSYHRTNMRLSWRDRSEHWSASLYVNNLEDDDVIDSLGTFSIIYGGNYTAQLKPPRTYGLTLSYSF